MVQKALIRLTTQIFTIRIRSFIWARKNVKKSYFKAYSWIMASKHGWLQKKQMVQH